MSDARHKTGYEKGKRLVRSLFNQETLSRKLMMLVFQLGKIIVIHNFIIKKLSEFKQTTFALRTTVPKHKPIFL